LKEGKLKRGKPSWTAEVSAAYRTAESDKPEDDRVCYDPISKHFLGLPFSLVGRTPPFIRRAFSKVAFWYAERLTPGNPGYVVARTRYIDDYLKSCINCAIQQLVILGAGYDTRAYRFSEIKGKVKVYEVDHPATQKLKKQKVTRAFGVLHDNVVYVSVDFGEEKLEDKMFESGYNKNLKTLFIWEGVIPYITAAGVDETFAFAANNSGGGSSIIFDYIFKSVIDGTNESEIAKTWRKTLDRLGEPFLFGIEEGMAEAFLIPKGFDEVKDVIVESLKEVYFKGKSRARQVFPFAGIVYATVRSHEYTSGDT
jgi:methyltransferase (TIGR00027 family)